MVHQEMVKVAHERLRQIMKANENIFHPLINWPKNIHEIALLDFSSANGRLQNVNLKNTDEFSKFINTYLLELNAKIGVGGYLEKRVLYKRSEVFEAEECRNIHLGVDIWAPAGTQVFAPLDGKVHSFQDNNAFGDYGATIILEHNLEGISFYSLYGHLCRASLTNLTIGKSIRKGEAFTEFGCEEENGNWPPHLHFQLILDMEGKSGDYPGVSAPSQVAKYASNCPDPNLILNLDILKGL